MAVASARNLAIFAWLRSASPEKLEGLDLGLHLSFLEAGLAAQLFELDAVVRLRWDFLGTRKDRRNVGHPDCLQEATLDRGQVVALGGGC